MVACHSVYHVVDFVGSRNGGFKSIVVVPSTGWTDIMQQFFRVIEKGEEEGFYDATVEMLGEDSPAYNLLMQSYLDDMDDEREGEDEGLALHATDRSNSNIGASGQETLSAPPVPKRATATRHSTKTMSTDNAWEYAERVVLLSIGTKLSEPQRGGDKQYDPHFIQEVAASGRRCVNVWGAISRQGLGPIFRIDGRLTSEVYSDIIDHVLFPYVLNGPFPDGDFWFQHDPSPIHTSRSTKTLLAERDIRELPWPPKGAYVNIVENV
ncbi:hypothetical protein HPB47_025985 [Ixodes persulcatus]|uniref:Uncharacterized protein n=1 Tax=Ixodes persulcatus TaxID=34615 RepID=A0AC60Q009_IXOPE|nr:hypothetical protein HPB47_025985 [Ixodes persulcatus]